MQVVAGFKASAFKSVTRVAFSGSNPELTWKLVLYGFPILFLKVVAYKDAAACTGSARRSVLKGARVERKPSRLLEGHLVCACQLPPVIFCTPMCPLALQSPAL